MTDEEKKAVKSFKQENENDLSRLEDFNDYTQTLIKRNNTILNLIQKQQAELKKKDKIIDLMERFIANLDTDENICKHQAAEFCEGTDGVSLDICVKCINQYFEKKVEEDE